MTNIKRIAAILAIAGLAASGPAVASADAAGCDKKRSSWGRCV